MTITYITWMTAPKDDYLIRPDPLDPRLTERVSGVCRWLDRNDRLHSYPQGRDREDRERNHLIFGERDVEGLRPHDRHVHQGLQVRLGIACDPQTVFRRSQALGHAARHVSALYRGLPAEITVARRSYVGSAGHRLIARSCRGSPPRRCDKSQYLLLQCVRPLLALSGHARRVGRRPLMGWTRRAPAPASRIAG